MGEFGFLGDVLETINQLGDLLKDRYKSGFPILKELIQNADDAEATEFHFGFLPNGVKECSHNLLITSSVFFINNGNFSEENDRAIRSMSISSKVEQKSTIGKFGLGMKSIFHLCEAYFYITPEFKKFFNPWDSNNNKKDNESLIFQRNEVWNSFTDEDKQKIEQFFSNAKLINPDKYFLLLVPLRKKSQLIVPKSKEEIGPIVSEYFDENRPEFLDNVNNPRDLALLFPLLKHLNSISYWIDNNENQLERKYKLDFSSQKRIRFKDDMNLNTYSGEIDGVTKIKYFGKEYIEDNKNVSSEFGKLKNDNEHWPKRLTRNENGKEVTIDDKAIPHYSILFQWIQTESGKGSISFKKAVFLPLSDDKEGTKDFEYQIVFHGYFFVDSGRRDIIEPKSNENSKFISEEKVKEYWNFLLMKNISEKFLETFDGFINEQKIEYDDQTLLTKKIVQSNYYDEYKKYICSQYSWLCVIQFNEDRTNLVRKWNLVPKKDEYIYLPLELRNGFDINCLNHESLKSIFENNNIYLYDKSLKGLYSEEIKNNWDDDYKKLIIKFIQSRFFQESNIENNIVIFLDILDGFQLFSIDCEEKIWKELVSIKTNYLLIRSEWIKKKSYSSSKPDIDDFRKWFEHLEKILENDDNSLYYKLSEQLYSESNNRDLEILKSYKVFKSYSCLDRIEVSISIKELEAIAGKGLLFRYSSGNATDRSKLATLFQDILLNHQIFLITQELANKTSLEYITPCDKKIILETLSKFDLELKKEHRVDLVKELNSLDINEKECIKGFRYLLHRSKNHKSDISENLWRKREAFDQKNVWYR